MTKEMVRSARAMTRASLLALFMGCVVACGGGGGGAGGGGGSGAGGGGTTTTSATSTTPTCEAYCTEVMKNCTGETGVYVSKDVCLAACAHIPVGKAADTTGNTLGCRTYHAGAAAGSADNAMMHCPHAGPGGAGYCGTNCEGYCNLAMGACSTYATQQDCIDTCATFADQEPFSAMNDITGNTLQCRLYHSSVASSDSVHCDHIGTMPTLGTCTDP